MLSYAENFSDPRQQGRGPAQTRGTPATSSVDGNLRALENFSAPTQRAGAASKSSNQRLAPGYAQTRPEMGQQGSAESAKSVLDFVENFSGTAASSPRPAGPNRRA